MSATTGFTENTDTVVRSAIREALLLDGPKRGPFRAASLLGVSERWIRSYRYGEPARVAAETYLRALHATRQLRAERHARLTAEIKEIEAANADLLDAHVAGAGLVQRSTVECGGSLREARQGAADAPGAVTP